jgi:hypothetical protein
VQQLAYFLVIQLIMELDMLKTVFFVHGLVGHVQLHTKDWMMIVEDKLK